MSANHFSISFYAFLYGRALFSAIDAIIITSVGWHIYTQTKDPFDLALVGLFQVAPVYLFFVVSGWVVDHVARKRILQLCALMQSLVFVAIALLMQADDFNKWYLFLLIAAFGSVKAFLSPAMQAILPNLVSPKQLNSALAITNTVWNAALMIGPVLAGLFIALIDRQVYWLAAGLSATVCVAYLWLPQLKAAQSDSKRQFSDLFQGIVFLKDKPIVFGSLFLDLLIVLGGSVVVLLPIYAADVLNVGPEGLGILRAMPAVGAVLIGIYVSKYKNEFEQTGHTLFIAMLVFALSIVLFGFAQNMWVACFALLIYGGSDMFSVVIRGAVVQHNTPDQLRGRVSALNSIFIASSNQLGDFRAGSVAALLGPVNTALIGGATALVVTAWGYHKFPGLVALKSAKYENDHP